MKKYIIIITFVLLLPVASYAKCCDCCKDNYLIPLQVTIKGTTYGTVSMHVIPPSNTGYININSTGVEKLIGKIVHRTKPNRNNEKNYMDRGRKLIAVTSEYLIVSSDILAKGQFELDRSVWDDGNWEEHKEPLRLIVNELVGTETFHIVTGTSNYSCIRCGNKLSTTPSPINYYCTRCNTGFDIKEE